MIMKHTCEGSRKGCAQKESGSLAEGWGHKKAGTEVDYCMPELLL